MTKELDWVPAVTASDMDGVWYLVALTDDVDGWKVTVTDPDRGERDVGDPEPFTGGYYVALLGRPAWIIEGARSEHARWRLSVDGRPVGIRGNRAGNVPDDSD